MRRFPAKNEQGHALLGGAGIPACRADKNVCPTWKFSYPHDRRGLTLVEVLMSMLVMGIGVLSVITLLPLAFVRSIQATNLTNATILRYNAESLAYANPRLLLRWQANWSYQVGDIVMSPGLPSDYFVCTTAGTSGLVTPTWDGTAGNPTNDGTAIWTAHLVTDLWSNVAITPRFVIDPLGWNSLPAALQGQLGNNGAGAPDANAIQRFNGELTAPAIAAQQVNSPDSWVEQARAPVATPVAANFTANSVTLAGVDLSGVAAPGTVLSRAVMIDATGKNSQTRLITGIASPTVSWLANDPLLGTFTPAQVRIETQELRYTWMLTAIPSTTSGIANVTVTTFFHRPLGPNDEQVFQATGIDGVNTPFTVTYGGTKPFAKKGGFLFDCYFGRWYRILNIANDTGTQFDVYVDRQRPQDDSPGLNPTFGAVFMRGVVDFFPLQPIP